MSPEGEARTGWAQQNALLGPSVRPPPLRAQSCRADRPSKAAYFRVPAGHEAQPIGVRASSPRSQALNFVSWDLSSGALPQPAAPPSPLHSPTGGCRGLTLAQNPSPPFPAGSPQAISFPPRGLGPLQGCGEQAPVTPCPSVATCLAEGVPGLQVRRAAGPVDRQVGRAVTGRPVLTSSGPAFGAQGSGAPTWEGGVYGFGSDASWGRLPKLPLCREVGVAEGFSRVRLVSALPAVGAGVLLSSWGAGSAPALSPRLTARPTISWYVQSCVKPGGGAMSVGQGFLLQSPPWLPDRVLSCPPLWVGYSKMPPTFRADTALLPNPCPRTNTRASQTTRSHT